MQRVKLHQMPPLGILSYVVVSCLLTVVFQSYCWWKKSCTSWYGEHPMFHKVLYIPGGAGFCPSTVPPEVNGVWSVCFWGSHKVLRSLGIYQNCRGKKHPQLRELWFQKKHTSSWVYVFLDPMTDSDEVFCLGVFWWRIFSREVFCGENSLNWWCINLFLISIATLDIQSHLLRFGIWSKHTDQTPWKPQFRYLPGFLGCTMIAGRITTCWRGYYFSRYDHVLGGGNSNVENMFNPILGEDSNFDWFLLNGLKPPTSVLLVPGKPPDRQWNLVRALWLWTFKITVVFLRLGHKIHKSQTECPSLWVRQFLIGSEIRQKSVEVVCLSHYFQGF